MFFLPIGIFFILVALGVGTWTHSAGGSDAVAIVAGHVLLGTWLYVISALLLVGGVGLVFAAIIKAIRRIVGLVALIFVLGGGSLTAFAAQNVNAFSEKQCAQEQELSYACAQLRGLLD